MVRRQATLGEQLFDITERARVPKIPADCAKDQFGRSLPALEDRRSRYLLAFSSSYQPPLANLQHVHRQLHPRSSMNW
jgi:hypothetical protein